MATKRDEKQYTHPELRQKLKEELMASDKGGKKGQWSARKSQLLVQSYEKQGGGYKGKKDAEAKALEKWAEEEWETKDQDKKARHKGETSRYLPKAVWEELSPQEKKEAENTKTQGSKKGQQHVAYTPAVQKAMQQVKGKQNSGTTKKELLEIAKKLQIRGRSRMSKAELAKAVQQEKK